MLLGAAGVQVQPPRVCLVRQDRIKRVKSSGLGRTSIGRFFEWNAFARSTSGPSKFKESAAVVSMVSALACALCRRIELLERPLYLVVDSPYLVFVLPAVVGRPQRSRGSRATLWRSPTQAQLVKQTRSRERRRLVSADSMIRAEPGGYLAPRQRLLLLLVILHLSIVAAVGVIRARSSQG